MQTYVIYRLVPIFGLRFMGFNIPSLVDRNCYTYYDMSWKYTYIQYNFNVAIFNLLSLYKLHLH